MKLGEVEASVTAIVEVLLSLKNPEYLVHSKLWAPAFCVIAIRRFWPHWVLSVAYADVFVNIVVHIQGAAVTRTEVLDWSWLNEAVVPDALELY